MTHASGTAAYEHNGAHTGAHAFYAVACDPRRHVAVEACAGAGKTWMLVSRIVRALLDMALADPQGRVRPHEILAITFTKKAAGEMRQRLHEWLVEFASASDDELAHALRIRGLDIDGHGRDSSEKSLPSAPDLRSVLRNLQHAVLAAGRPVQVRTFHGWFAGLLQTAPVAVLQALGLPPQYELLEDDAEAVAQVWPRFHAALLDDAAGRADFDALVALHGRHGARKALNAALARRTEFGLADAVGVVDRSVAHFQAQFIDLAAFDTPDDALATVDSRGLLLAAASALGRASAPTFSAKGGELEQAVAAGDADGMRAALLTQAGAPRKFGEKIVGIDTIREAQGLVLRIAAASRQHDAWQHQQRMARLTRQLAAEFAACKRERGWVDMNDVERAAHTLLADPVLAGWVQERLDARIRHLLVDEFQDTNPLQWQALHAWLSGYAGAGRDGPGVFIVGDPKQSIYRFRRAEPQVFLAAQAFIVQGLGGDLLRCDHTRRNAPEVVVAVNAAMLAAQDDGAYAGYRAHTTDASSSGSVQQLPVVPRGPRAAGPGGQPMDWRDSLATPRDIPEETLRTLECRQAAHWLVREMAADGLAPGDVMVLARKRDRLAAMQEALRTVGIPAQQPEKNDLGDMPEVQDVVALLDALVSPAHDLALARALRSPLFGVADADLVALSLAQRATPGTPWLQLLLSQSEHLAKHLRALGPVLTQFQQWVHTLPPHDALVAIYHAGDVVARFAAAAPPVMRSAVLANIRALPRAALELGGGRFATPYAFVRAMKRGGIRAPVQADAGVVRLLTVHGAKGLEAPLVLLLDTDAPASKAESMGVLIDWPGEALAPRRFVFLASESSPPDCSADALATEQAARRTEELNALYVALTRAKRRVVLSSVEPHAANDGSWWRRLHGLGTGADAAPVPGAAAQGDDDMTFYMPNVPAAPASVALAAINIVATEPMDPAARRQNAIGLAMHRLLEWAPRPRDAAAQRAVAAEFALPPADAAEAARIAERILAGEGAWAWDPAQLDWQGNEVALAHAGVPLRIDRLVRRRDDGAWWVLDHKSAAAPQRQPALRAQLLQYREAVRALHPGAAVHAAFLTGQGALVALEE